MAGVAATDLLIGRIDGRAAGVAALDLLHPDDIEEHRLGAPEAAACQYRDLVHIRISLPLRGDRYVCGDWKVSARLSRSTLPVAGLEAGEFEALGDPFGELFEAQRLYEDSSSLS